MKITPRTSDTPLYKIPSAPKKTILYDTEVQKLSYIQANITGIFDEWYMAFFDGDYFSTKRIQTQANFADFKSFMRDIYKKGKPMCLINPEIELVEDHFYNQASSSMYNNIYANQDYAHKMLYSSEILRTETCSLSIRMNRYITNFSILLIESTLARQLDMYAHILKSYRHSSKFLIEKMSLSLIPRYMMDNVARLNGYELLSKDFLMFINERSMYPIIKRITANGQPMFYMGHKVSIYVDIPSMPEKDSVENIGAIEKGARVVDRVVFEMNLPAEFILSVPEDKQFEFVKYKDENNVYYTSPYKADMEYDMIYMNDYYLMNVIDVIADDQDNKIDIRELIINSDTTFINKIYRYMEQGLDVFDIMKFRIFENKDETEVPFDIVDNHIIIQNPNEKLIYAICIYIDNEKLNKLIEDDDLTRSIGTITEKTSYTEEGSYNVPEV